MSNTTNDTTASYRVIKDHDSDGKSIYYIADTNGMINEHMVFISPAVPLADSMVSLHKTVMALQKAFRQPSVDKQELMDSVQEQLLIEYRPNQMTQEALEEDFDDMINRALNSNPSAIKDPFLLLFVVDTLFQKVVTELEAAEEVSKTNLDNVSIAFLRAITRILNKHIMKKTK